MNIDKDHSDRLTNVFLPMSPSCGSVQLHMSAASLGNSLHPPKTIIMIIKNRYLLIAIITIAMITIPNWARKVRELILFNVLYTVEEVA